MKGKRLIEHLKTVLIVVLVITALLMVPRIEPLSALFSDISISNITGKLRQNSDTNVELEARLDLSSPMSMAYTGSQGRAVFQYDTESLSAVYEPVSTLVSEAFGSASGFESVEEKQLQQALSKQGLYLDYGGDIPPQVLAAWLGTSVAQDFPQVMVRRALLARSGSGTELYIIGSGENEIYKGTTAVRFSNISSAFGDAESNPGAFAFELGSEFSGIDPYTLILGQEYILRELTVQALSASSTGTQQLLKRLDFNTVTASVYSEADGTLVYVENDCTVRLSRNGYLSYRTMADSGSVTVQQEQGTEIAQAAALAISIAESSGVLDNTGTRAYLESVTMAGEEITVKFGRAVNGVPVYSSAGESFVTMTVTEGVVTLFEMDLTVFAAGETTKALIPERMAVAAAKEEGKLELAYLSDGFSVMSSWLVK